MTPGGVRRLLDGAWLAYDLVGRHRPPAEPSRIDPHAPATLLTSVLRLAPDDAEHLATLTRGALDVDPGHVLTPPTSIHATLVQAADGRADPAALEAALGASAERLRGVPVSLSLIGLAVTPRSLVAVGLPDDDRLARERATLRPLFGRPAGAWHAIGLLDGVVHVTLARWSHRPSASAVAAVRAMRHRPLLAAPCVAIELVRTNHVMGEIVTTRLARFALTMEPGWTPDPD